MEPDNYPKVRIKLRQDGTQYKVHGYIWDGNRWSCPTEKCNVPCCRVTNILAEGVCPKLTKNLRCEVEELRGLGAKPWGCVQFPRSQEEIDTVNKASSNGEYCQLWVEEIK